MFIIISQESPDSDDALSLINELDAYLNLLPYPQQSRHAFSVDKLLREGVIFFVTRYEGQPAACGAIKLFEEEYGEVKRMYVRPGLRGLGLGKGMLNHLADFVRDKGINVLRLETGIFQTEAIGLYEHYGFVRRAPFGEYVEDPMSVYFEKRID